MELLSNIAVIDFDSNCAMSYGIIRAKLLQTGLVSNGVDLLIAAVAITHNLTLVTHNVKDFQGIPNLRIEDWLES